MRPVHAALLTGAAALAGLGGVSLGGGAGAKGKAEDTPPLWARPIGVKVAAVPCAAGRCWSSEHRAAMLWEQPDGLVIAAAGPGARTAVTPFDLRVPLSDPLLLGDAPVTLSLSYALVRERGWVDARIDAQAMAGRRRFEVVGAEAGGETMTMVLPAETVRAQGGVTLHVVLTVRTLGDGAAKLELRSVALAGG